jgi:hypothetical protein
MSIDFTQEELERIKQFVPTTVKKRKLALDSLGQELRRRGFKSLDESSDEDLAKVVQIASDMFPQNTPGKIREYAITAIRLWRKQHA